MTAKAIQYYLAQDVIDGSASTVSTNNPTLWPTASDVPDYAFESLGTIWLGAPSLSSDLYNKIVYAFGSNTNTTGNSGEITLYTQPIESVLFDRVKDNTIGAEETNLIIRLFKVQRPNSSTTAPLETMQNAELRLRYLLDGNWRRLRKGVPPQIPSTGDKSINPNVGVYLTWEGFITPPTATEIQVRYKAYYVRSVPQVP